MKRKVAGGVPGNFRGVCPISNRATGIPTRYVLVLLAMAGVTLLWRECVRLCVCFPSEPSQRFRNFL